MTDAQKPQPPSRNLSEIGDLLGLDLRGIDELHAVLNEDGPLEVSLADFRPYAPLFQTTMVLEAEERKRLTDGYLAMVQWGYRPVHVVATDADGTKHVVLKLPRIFIQTTTPTSEEHTLLRAINTQASQGAIRADQRERAHHSYMSSFLQAQDNDQVLDSIKRATVETDEILIQFVKATQGEAATPKAAQTVISPGASEWSFEE